MARTVGSDFREEIVRELWHCRWSDAAIADRAKCTARTVGRIRGRLSLPAWEMWQQTRQFRRIL